MSKEEEDGLILETRRFLRRSDVAFLFHLMAFALYVKVWMWHTTPAALALPGSTGFGWFFRYLTFWSYTLQLIQLACCVLAHLTKHHPTRKNLTIIADKLSCVAFGIANTVTAMFYAVESSTQGLVEGGLNDRPWWLATAVHIFNSIVAWIDLFIVEERTFSGHSRHLSMYFAITYVSWLILVRYVYGKFPYPVLNALPQPWGVMGFSIAGVLIVVTMFEIGRFTKHRLIVVKKDGNNGNKKKVVAVVDNSNRRRERDASTTPRTTTNRKSTSSSTTKQQRDSSVVPEKRYNLRKRE